VESRIVVDGADAVAGLASLIEWLRCEPELRGRIRIVRRSPEPGDMGALVEVLAVAVGGGGILTVLANSLSVWLRQPRRLTVRISLTKPDGTEVEVTGENLRTAEEIEDLLRRCSYPDKVQ
jgi:membrane-associated two-gene conflict system component 1 (EACC1)